MKITRLEDMKKNLKNNIVKHIVYDINSFLILISSIKIVILKTSKYIFYYLSEKPLLGLALRLNIHFIKNKVYKDHRSSAI